MTYLGSIQFRETWLLLAGLAAIPVVLLSWRSAGRLVFSSLSLLPAHTSTWRTRLAWVPHALLGLAVVALAIAMAGPRVGRATEHIEREGIAIMMVVDVSGSMQALDLSSASKEQTRLQAVQSVFEEFVLGRGDLPGRPNDAVGLVTFARYADSRCPLTLDHENLAAIARSLEIVPNRSSENATAIGDGLGLAVERLRRDKHASKVVILLTDGVNNAGEETPLSAADLARTLGIKVYTVGAGTNGMAPVRVPDMFSGGTSLRRMRVEIDEKTLEAIASSTGGKYFRAADLDGLRAVYKEIDRLERTKHGEDHLRDWNEYYAWFVALGLLLAVLAWIAKATVWRRLPC